MLRRGLILATFLAILLIASEAASGGWPWSKELDEQSSIQPQEQPLRKPPEGTIPVKRGDLISTREEADKKLSNPVEITGNSLANGKKLYDIFCALCHGDKAKGEGPLASKYIQPPDLAMDFYKERSDGHIYGTIRFGSVIMPAYGETMFSEEIWDVVNYLRTLQGR